MRATFVLSIDADRFFFLAFFRAFHRDYAVKRVLGKVRRKKKKKNGKKSKNNREFGQGAYAKALLVANRKTGHLFTCKQLLTSEWHARRRFADADVACAVEEDVSSEIDLLIAVSGETPFLCR